MFAMRRFTKPTDAELAILRALWERGPSTVKGVHQALESAPKKGYTTVLKLMQIMFEKGLVTRDESSFAHVYQARIPQELAERSMVADLMDRAFGGSMSRLIMRALTAKQATPEELAEIRRILRGHSRGDQ
jgi:predicted transcriptional regulator